MKTPRVLKQALALALVASGTLAPGAGATEREKAGNGGNAAVCFNSPAEVKRIKANENRIANDQLGKITSIKALDLYQAEAAFKGRAVDDNLVLPHPGEDAPAFVLRIAHRFSDTLPTLRDVIKATAATFDPKKNTYYTEGGIDRIFDTAEKYYLDPSKCVIATLIRRTTVGGRAELEFDWRLFDHPAHKNESRGVLMLHEVVYQWGEGLKHEDSANTRRLIANALLRRRLSRHEVLQELVNSKFAVDSRLRIGEAAGTPELSRLGSVFAVTDPVNQRPTSKEFRNWAKGVLARLKSDSAVNTLGELGTIVADLQRPQVLVDLPHPKADALTALSWRIHDLGWRIPECERLLGLQYSSPEKRKCRRELPAMRTNAAALEERKKILEAEVAAESAGNVAATRHQIEAWMPTMAAEFARLAVGVETELEARLARIDTLPWFDREVAALAAEQTEKLKEWYRFSKGRYPTSVYEEERIFSRAWKQDRVIPAVD